MMGAGVMRSIGLTLLVVLGGPLLRAETPRILMVGDSWAELMWRQRSISRALEESGLGEFCEAGETTALGGTTAAQWTQESYQEKIRAELNANPTIDIIHLSIGGNDFLGSYTGLESPEELDAKLSRILDDIEGVVDAILEFRPDLRILLVEYDFVPGAVAAASVPDQNAVLVRFARARLALARRKRGLSYVLNLGLMHAVFGHPPDFEAGATPLPGGPPGYEPLPGGDPAFGGPAALFADPIHLTAEGYLALARRAVEQFYGPWLRAPEAVPGLSAVGTLFAVASLLAVGIFLLERRGKFGQARRASPRTSFAGAS